MDMEHIGYALPILLQGSLHLVKEALRLAAFLYGLPFLGSETTHYLFEFLCALTSRVGGNHLLIEVIAFQLGIELGDLLFQSFHLVEEFLHILPFLRVRTLQSRRPQVGVLVKRSLGLHLLGVKVNLAIYCESVDLAVLAAELLCFLFCFALCLLLFLDGFLNVFILAPFQISVLGHFNINELRLWKFFFQFSLLL